ncbi:MAG: flavodoxin family protein [Salinigranum sp.]
MRTLVVYYSRTGNTRAVARAIASRLDAPTVERIRPAKRRPYWNWLLRSAVPGSRVDVRPVETVPSRYDAVFLGTPKWTLSCPPVTEYLERVDFGGATVGAFLTYGGFDEERYRRRLVEKVRDRGGTVAATALVRRDAIGTPEFDEAIGRFCREVTDG